MKYMNREYRAPLSTLHRGVLGDTPAAEVMDHYEDVINKINILACLAGRLSSETGAASAAYSHLAMDGDGEPSWIRRPRCPVWWKSKAAYLTCWRKWRTWALRWKISGTITTAPSAKPPEGSPWGL